MQSTLGLRKAPGHTTLYRFLRRVDEQALVAVLKETFQRLPKKHCDHHEQEPAATVALDATGLAPGAISTFYVYGAHKTAVVSPCLYRRRALAESVFSAVKRKLSARAPGRSLGLQRMQALVLGLAYTTSTGSDIA